MEDTRDVSFIVAPELAVSFTVNVIVAALPLVKLPSAHLTVPAALTAGCEHVPAVVVTLWYVVPAGTVSVKFAPTAVSGPLFVTLIV